jgi:hypothetical protein
MTVFRWFMRNGALILFLASLVIFIVSFGSSFFITGRAMEQLDVGPAASRLWVFFGAVGQGLNNAVWSFLGACLLYRLDRRWPGGEGGGQ